MNIETLSDIKAAAFVRAIEQPFVEPQQLVLRPLPDPVIALLSDGGAQGRWSYLCLRPQRLAGARRDLWGAIEACLPAGVQDAGPAPFCGGAVAVLPYDLGEGGQGAQTGQVFFIDSLLAFDHQDRRLFALGFGLDAAAAQDLAQAAADDLAQLRAKPVRPDSLPLAERFAPDRPPEDYLDAVAQAIEEIAAGRYFQVNLARSFSGVLSRRADPAAVFARLNALSPAPFSALLRWENTALVSNSPEQFLAFDPEGQVEARPIKGTAPRGADAASDAALAAALRASPKDRAENLMIVDLMRNDLSRSCAAGSVAVEALCQLETYANVHHLVSSVTGRLAEDVRPAEALRRAFPPGSVTGAPKTEAMKRIAGFEGDRGIYCGALAWFSVTGAAQSSVLIRSLGFVRIDGRWRFRAGAGAGIVADSDPGRELAETEAKIARIRLALTGTDEA